MAITASQINTKGAVITIGGVLVHNPDSDGYYWGTVSGTDLGCTTGGITIKYKYTKKDIFCDQTISAITAAITEETAEISCSMLETTLNQLHYVIQTATYLQNLGVERKVAVGGSTVLTYFLLKLEIVSLTTGLLTTWTFFRVLSTSGIDINFDRDKPSEAKVTFTCFADTTKPVGYQMFSIREALA